MSPVRIACKFNTRKHRKPIELLTRSFTKTSQWKVTPKSATVHLNRGATKLIVWRAVAMKAYLIEVFLRLVFKRSNILHGQSVPLIRPAKHLSVEVGENSSFSLKGNQKQQSWRRELQHWSRDVNRGSARNVFENKTHVQQTRLHQGEEFKHFVRVIKERAMLAPR